MARQRFDTAMFGLVLEGGNRDDVVMLLGLQNARSPENVVELVRFNRRSGRPLCRGRCSWMNWRRVALRHGLTVLGTARVLIQARRRGIISSVSPVLDELQISGYYFSDKLIELVLRRCGEAE